MKRVLVALLLVLVVSISACGPPLLVEEFEATVVDMSVSAGGFGSATVYLVGFDNGKKIAFSTGQFVVGNRYYIKCSIRPGWGNDGWDVIESELIQ